MIEVTEKDLGRYVVYTGFTQQRGRIKSFNDCFVFVVYKCNDDWDNYKKYIGCATKREDLIFNDQKQESLMIKQKFKIFTFVHVCKEVPLENDFDGIVEGTYNQLCGGMEIKNFKRYSLYQIENNVIVNGIAWYNEYQISKLPKQDIIKAKEMIIEYLKQKGRYFTIDEI